jgi:hypothetical protein
MLPAYGEHAGSMPAACPQHAGSINETTDQNPPVDNRDTVCPEPTAATDATETAETTAATDATDEPASALVQDLATKLSAQSPVFPTEPMGYEAVETIGVNHLQMRLPGAAVQDRLRAVCPVDPRDWRAAVTKVQEVGAHNFKYLAGVLETLTSDRQAPRRKREVVRDEPKPGYLSRTVDDVVNQPPPEECSKGPPPGWADAIFKGEGK